MNKYITIPCYRFIREFKLWEWFFLLCVFSFALCYVKSRVSCPTIDYSFFKYGKPKKIKVDGSSFSNGDLLFLSGTTGGEKSCRWATDSPFSHVAILFQEAEIWYVLECDIGSHHIDGIRILTLQNKLSRKEQHQIVGYRKLTDISCCMSQKRLSSQDFINIYQKYHSLFKFDTNMTKWMTQSLSSSATKRGESYSLLRKKMFCSEFVCFALDVLGICSFNQNYYSYSPGELTNWEYMNMHKGKIYNPLELLHISF